MDTRTFENIVADQMDLIKSVLMQGAKEYANIDRLANFKGVAEKLKISPGKVALVYLLKHIDGICKYVETGEAQRDTLNGRITDAINYLILLRAICAERDLGLLIDPFAHQFPPVTTPKVHKEIFNPSDYKDPKYHDERIGERSNNPAPKGLGGV